MLPPRDTKNLLEISIDQIAYGGEGVGKVQGKVCFVENALPGEKVLAMLTQTSKSFLKARAVEILVRSPHREVPPCRFIDDCGGCQYQHVTYEEEIRWKTIQVREYLKRHLKIDPERVRPIVPSESCYHSRNSVTLHKVPGKDKSRPGAFFAKDNISLVPVTECLLADKNLSAVFQNLHDFPHYSEELTFRLGADGKTISSGDLQFFEITVGGETIITHSRSFFQNNLGVTAQIGSALKKWVDQYRPDVFFDLYAGTGTFSLLAAREVPRIVLIEENSSSLDALQKNITARNLPAEVVPGTVERVLSEALESKNFQNGFAFLDPPRKGLESGVSSYLCRKAPFKTIVYLSCHLGTLTRDLAALLKNEHYSVREVLPFDMFPRTKHIEIAVLLEHTP